MRIRIEFEGSDPAAGAVEIFVKPERFEVGEDGTTARLELTPEKFPFDPRVIKKITAWDLSRPAFTTKWSAAEFTVGRDPGVVIELELEA